MVKNAVVFIIVTVVLTIVSFMINREKTILGIKKGFQMFRSIAVPFLNILILVSLAISIIPASLIETYLGAGSGIKGLFMAALIGSITLIPGFISYPIAAFLIADGASYTTVATFMTTLMMVGVVTLPLEIRYFGKRAAILRNILNFVAAVVIGVLVGVIL
jgi:uncharacterized membrane protein YraQ (UPF0718 family)